MSMVGPWEETELEIWERPPSTLRNIDGGPLRGAGAGDPGGSTINTKKRRQWALKSSWSWRSRSTHHQR
jgi:hypothetical protein